MPHWTIGKLARLSDVSVQTLHHYDKIGLLKPSLRSQAGYRHYCEEDLVKLQQIIALKFFGCELKVIKAILEKKHSLLEHLILQEKMIQKQIDAMTHARTLLQETRDKEMQDQVIEWEATRQLIEVYHMTQHLEHPWVKDIFTFHELKEYTAFEKSLRESPSLETKNSFEKSWTLFIGELSANLEKDPEGEDGIRLAGTCMSLVNALYTPEHRHLRTKKFEKGFGEGLGLEDVGFTKASVSWLEKAVNAYWKDRLKKLFKHSQKKHPALLKELLVEIYGKDEERKKKLLTRLLTDDTLDTHEKMLLKEAIDA